MEQWPSLRGFIHENQFVTDAVSLGITPEDLNDVVADFEQVLCGITDERLDAIYPCHSGDWRVFLTEERLGVPRLRIAFRLASEGDKRIQLLRCGLRV